MGTPGTVDQSKVLPVVHLLQEQFPQLVFNEPELRKHQVRLRFAGYDEDNGMFKPYAGLIATRRQWSRQPEPTLIFGFENDEFLQLSEEAGILEQPGVHYVPYSAGRKQVQRAIDTVLEELQPVQNDELFSLNEKDLLDWISQFRHRFKTDIGTLRFRYNKLVSADRKKIEKQYGFLAAMRKDYILKEKQRYMQLLTDIRGTTVFDHYHNILSHIEECINRADREWQQLHTQVQEPFSSKVASNAASLLKNLIVTLEEMYSLAREMRVR